MLWNLTGKYERQCRAFLFAVIVQLDPRARGACRLVLVLVSIVYGRPAQKECVGRKPF